MKFLLDTNVISELIKSSPDPNVLAWFTQVPEEHTYISVLTLGELSSGIDKLPDGIKKNDLILWFDKLSNSFSRQTFPIDSETAVQWSRLSAARGKQGRPLPVIDGLIAASAYRQAAVLVTRNTSDFESLPIQIINPWL
ncbi:MAG: type II toxin-antitoxin system VapC family toxin [Spirochaetia bacterium]|nr:type II toxin-antitoxin system VapC family toxin [Spirochaetia bacterium]